MMKWPWHNRKKGPSGLKQSGNVLFVLFGAVAIAGVVGASANMLMRGPIKSMGQLNQSTITKTQLETASRMMMLDAANLEAADCDGDRLNEAREWKAAGGLGPDGVAGSNGGGFIPDAVGASKRDTWGTRYGYCVWDHGAAIDTDSCGGATQKRLQGANTTALPVIAIISAGKDKIFQTPCRDFGVADVNANGKLGDIGDLELITPTGDDMVSIYSYAEANEENPNLWSLGMDGDGNVVATMDGAVKNVTFSGESASFDGQFKLTGAKGLVMPDQNAVPNCNVSTEGQVRRNTLSDPSKLEFCKKVSASVFTWETMEMGDGTASGGGGGGSASTEKETSPTNGDFRMTHILQADVPQANALLGNAIDMDERYVAFGSSSWDGGTTDQGAVYVFNYITGQQISRLTASDPTATSFANTSGDTIALRGNYVLVGDWNKNSSFGAAYLFNATTGVQLQKFTPPVSVALRFGRSVALSDKYAYIGASSNTGNAQYPNGAVFVYEISTGALVKTITPPDHVATIPLPQSFGFTMDINGNVLLVGAPYATVKNSGGTNPAQSGAAYLFNATTGEEIAALTAPSPNIQQYFGFALAISEKYAVIAMPDDASGLDTGHIHIYDAITGAYVRTLGESDDTADTMFGVKVDAYGDYAIVGATNKDTPQTKSGSAYIYNLSTGAETIYRPPTPSSNHYLGNAIAMYGRYAIAGAAGLTCTAGVSCGGVYVLNNGDHHGGRVNVTQTADANDTIGNLAWTNTLATDTNLSEAGIAFGLGPQVTSNMAATAAITAVREGNPNASGLAFKFNNGANQLVTGIYLGTNNRLRFAPIVGDSAKIYAYLQIGEHGGTAWNTGYIDGMLITSETGTTDLPVYFGYQNDTVLSQTGAVVLFPKVFEIGRINSGAPQAVTPVLTMDSAGTLYGDVEQYAAASSAQRIGAYNTTVGNDGRLIFSKRRGGAGLPGLPLDGDTIGSIVFRGHDGTTYPGAAQAQIKAVVNGTASTGNIPVDLVFGLDPAGNADGNEAMRITSAGLVGINKPIPEAMLHVGGRIVASTVIKIGNDTTCATTADANTIRYAGGVFEYCNGSAWTSLAGGATASISDKCSPMPFDFLDKSNLVINTFTATNQILISGLSGTCYMTVSSVRNEQFTLNGTFQSSIKMIAVKNGDVVSISANSVNAAGGVATMVVTLGDKSDEFTYTTAENCTTTIGTLCSDGTKYAGLNAEDSIPTFVTRCDYGMSWNGSSCTGTRGTLPWNDGTTNYTDTTRPNLTNGNISGDHENSFKGQSNTLSLSANDASSVTGIQSHAAAMYCYNLVESGRSDWYLPSIQELKVMDTNSTAIQNFITSSGSIYWSSNENEASEAWTQSFSSHGRAETTKQTGSYVRCMRKGVL